VEWLKLKTIGKRILFHISDRVQVVERRDNRMYNAMITKREKIGTKFMHGYRSEKGKDYIFLRER
jgi:hypothetical protein